MLKQKVLKQFLPMLLSIAMILGELPITALAAEDNQPTVAIEEQQEVAVDELDTYNEGEAASATLGAAVIKVNQKAFGDNVVDDYSYDYDYTTNTASTTYAWVGNSDYGLIAENMIDAAKSGVITVEINGLDNQAYGYDPYLVFKWQQKGADGKFADMITADTKEFKTPIDAGTYRLTVSREATDTCAAAAAVTVADLEIKPAVLKLDPTVNFNTVKAGFKVSDIIKLNSLNVLPIKRGNETTLTEQARYIKEGTFKAKVQKRADGKFTDIPETEVLVKEGDYYLVFDLEVADANYTVEQKEFLINFANDTREVMIDVTYKTGDMIQKKYTGDAVSLEGEYTAKVVTKDVVDDDGYVIIPGGDVLNVPIVGTWCDAKGVPYTDKDFVPVDAGIYIYRLSLNDENYKVVQDDTNLYYVDIRVDVRMVDVAIQPELKTGAQFAVNMTAAAALERVGGYRIYEVSGGDLNSDIFKKETFWGVYPNAAEAGTTQYYQPVFGVQRGRVYKDADGKKDLDPVWETGVLPLTTKLENGFIDPMTGAFVAYKYRIVFTGKKTVYDVNAGYPLYYDDDKGEYRDYSEKYSIDINAAQGNYTVVTTDAMIADNAVDITLSPAMVVIDVSEILGDKKGTFAEPIAKTYDGKQLYESKKDYKVAKVTVTDGDLAAAGDTIKDPRANLSYQWQFASDIKYKKNAKDIREYSVDEDAWEDVTWNNVEVQTSPSGAGLYRLKVSYSDPEHMTYAEDAYIYYAIQPQNVAVYLEGATAGQPATPTIFADGENTTADLLASLQNTDPSKTDTYVNPVVYAVTIGTDGAITKGAATGIETYIMEYPEKYLRVEKLVEAGENKGKWVTCGNETLTADTKYRISLKAGLIEKSYYDEDDNDWYLSYKYRTELPAPYGWYADPNYNFGQKLNVYGRLDKDEDEDFYYGEGAAAVTVKESNGVKLNLEIDPEAAKKVQNMVKVYDGKAFDLTAIKDAVRFIDMNGEDKTAAVKDKVVYTLQAFTSLGNYSNIPETEATHAGTYYVDITLPADATYKGHKWNSINTQFSATIQIKRKELVIRPLVKSGIKAGTPYNQFDQILENCYVPRGEYRWNTNDSYEIIDPATGEKFGTQIIENPSAEFAYGVYESNGSPLLDSKLSTRDGNTPSAITVERLKHDKIYYVKIRENYTNMWGKLISCIDYEDYPDYDLAYSKTSKLSYGIDYELIHELVPFTVEQVAAEVEQNNVSISHSAKLEDGVFDHMITTQAGVSVPFDTTRKGNYFRVVIKAPVEFQGQDVKFEDLDFVYVHSIKEAGGSVEEAPYKWDFKTGTYHYYDAKDKVPYIIVEFNADLEAAVNAENKGVHKFEIFWTKDYKETYTVDLSKATLQADFEKAVLPKTFKFASNTLNMAVGDVQQLDVRITKNQKNDIILLGYDLADAKYKNIVAVSDSGYVTALSQGTAKVIVYPCRMVNGVKTRIEKNDKGKEVKPKTITIKVKAVAKPASLKVTPKDTWAEVQYKKPANGSRREIYVLEGKKKESDFKTAIDAVKDGNYSGFVAVEFVTSEYPNAKNIVTTWINGLKPNKQYSVYVRNVSGLRTLEDGSQVVADAAGAAPKTFTTKKSRVLKLEVDFWNADGTKNLRPEDNPTATYAVATLGDKAEKVTTKGMFKETYLQNYSDDGDYIWRKVPLTDKNEKKVYDQPKLTYYAYSEAKYGVKANAKDIALFIPDGSYDDAKGAALGTNYYATKVISVNKNNGTVTFKSKGTAKVLVRDSVSGEVDDLTIEVKAKEESIQVNKTLAKKGVITLMPGTGGIYLSDYIDYYQKIKGRNVKLEAPDKGKLDIGDASSEFFKIERKGKDYYIEAIKPNGKLQITVKDESVANSSAAITLSSAPIAQVKSPKKTAVTPWDDKVGVQHNQFTVQFTYPYSSYDFRLEVKDGAGRIVTSKIETLSAYDWDAKKKIGTYYVTFDDDYAGIDKLLTYTVKIDAVYQNKETGVDYLPTTAKGKAVKSGSVKVKTTNIAASYYALASKLYTAKDTGAPINGTTSATVSNKYVARYYGGMGVQIGYDIRYSDPLSDRSSNVVKAGNTYVLSATSSADYEAQMRKSDTLVWKSKNKNVATVKALTSGYTASLKAVKPGTAIIEASSKLTKKTVARYKITVMGIGDADDYFGDYVPYGEYKMMTANERDTIVLTQDTPVKVGIGEKEAQWFVFTAPAYGKYTFESLYCSAYLVESKDDIDKNGNLKKTGYRIPWSQYWDGSDWNWAGYGTRGQELTLEKGEKRYIYLYGTGNSTVKVTGEMYQEIYDGVNKVKGEQNVRFTALEENCYIVTVLDGESVVDKWSWRLAKGQKITTKIDGSANKEYTVKIEKRETVGLTLDTEAALPDMSAGVEKWYAFTATEDNIYDFATVGSTRQMSMAFYNKLSDDDEDDINTLKPGTVTGPTLVSAGDYKFAMPMDKGQKTYVKVTLPDDGETVKGAKLKVSRQRKLEDTKIEVDKEADLGSYADTETVKWFAFTAPKDGAYNFVWTVKDGRVNPEYYKKLNGASQGVIFNTTITGPEITYDAGQVTMKANQTIYLCLKADSLDTDDAGKDKAASVKLMVTQRALKKNESLTANAANAEKPVEEPISLKAGQDAWYKFTAPAYDYYTFSVTGEAVKADAKDTTPLKTRVILATYASLDADVNGVADYASGKDLKVVLKDQPMEARETIYLRVIVDGDDDATLKLAVTKRSITELQDTSAGDITLPANQIEQWFEYTVKSTDRYTFTAAADNAVNVDFYYSLSDKYEPIYSMVDNDNLVKDLEKPLQEGVKVYIKVTRTDGVGLSTAVKGLLAVRGRGTAAPQKDTDKIALKKFDQKWIKITADEANQYKMELSEKDNKAFTADLYRSMKDDTADLGSITIATTGDDAGTGEATFAIPDAGYPEVFYLRLSTMADSAEVTVKWTKLNKVTGKINDKGVDASLEGGEGKVSEAWYSFTADADGFYTLSASEKAGGDVTVVDVYNSLTGYGYIGGNTLNANDEDVELYANYMRKGTTIYVKVELGTTGTATVTLKGAKVDAKTFTDSKATATAEKDVPQWFVYDATEKGIYSIYATMTKAEEGKAAPKAYMTVYYEYGNGTYWSEEVYNTSDFIDYGDYREYDNYIGGNTKADTMASWTKNLLKTQKVYIKVMPNDAANSKVVLNLKVSKATVEETKLALGTTGTEIKLKNAEDVWYEFDATEENLYKFSFKTDSATAYLTFYRGKDISSAVQVNEWPYWDGTCSTSDSAKEISMPNLGNQDKIFVKVNAPDASSTSEVKFSMIIEKREPEKKVLTTGTPVEIELSGESDSSWDEVWYEFDAEETNRYTFYSDDVKEGKVGTKIYVSYYEELSSKTAKDSWEIDKTTTTASSEIKANAGSKAYIRVSGQAGVKATLKVKKREVRNVMINGETLLDRLTLKSGDSKWYSFTAQDEGYYTIYADDVQNGKLELKRANKLTDAAHSEATSNSDGYLRKTWWLDKDDEMFIQAIPSSVDADKSLIATLMARKGSAPDINKLQSDGVAVVTLQDVGQEGVEPTWFSYTPSAKGIYDIVVNGVAGGEVHAEICENKNDDDPIEAESCESDEPISIKLERDAGKTFWVKLYTYNSLVNATLTVKERKAEGAVSATGTEVTVGAGESKWYSITAGEDDVYFYVKAVGNSVKVTISESLDEDDALSGNRNNTINSAGRSYTLSKNKKYYVKVSPNGSGDRTAILKAKPYKAVELTEGADAVSVSLMTNERAWYSFKVMEDGIYEFSLEDAADGEIQLMLGNSMDASEYGSKFAEINNPAVVQRKYSAVKTLYVTVRGVEQNNSRTPATAKLKVKKIVPDVTMTAGTPESVSLTSAKKEMLYAVETTASGMYDFTMTVSTGDVYVTAYDDDFREIETGDILYISNGNSKSIGVYSSGSEKIYLKVTLSYYSTSATGLLTVKKRASDETLTAGVAGGYSLAKGEEKWFTLNTYGSSIYKASYAGTGGAVEVSYYIELYQPVGETVYPGGRTFESRYGSATVYVKVRGLAEGTSTGTVKVENMVVGSLDTTVSLANITLNDGDEKWYSLSVYSDKNYICAISKTTGGAVEVIVYEGASRLWGCSATVDADTTGEINFKTGSGDSNYYIRLYKGYDGSSATVSGVTLAEDIEK